MAVGNAGCCPCFFCVFSHETHEKRAINIHLVVQGPISQHGHRQFLLFGSLLSPSAPAPFSGLRRTVPPGERRVGEVAGVAVVHLGSKQHHSH